MDASLWRGDPRLGGISTGAPGAVHERKGLTMKGPVRFPIAAAPALLAPVLRVVAIAAMALAVAASAGTTRDAAAALPPRNTVAQWNQIAEDIVVRSGGFLPE